MFINLLFFFSVCLQLKYISTVDVANDVVIKNLAFNEHNKISFLNVSFQNSIFAFSVNNEVDKANDIIVFQSANKGISWKRNNEMIRNPFKEMMVIHYIFVVENEIVLIFVSGYQAFLTRSVDGFKWEIPKKINENLFDNNMGYYSGKSINLNDDKKHFIFMCINNNTYIKEGNLSDGECAISYDKGNNWIRDNYIFVNNNFGKINYENPIVYNDNIFFPIYIFSEDRYSYAMCNKYEKEQNFYCVKALFTAPGYEISHVTAMNNFIYAILSKEGKKKIGISNDGIQFFHSTKIPEGKEYNFVLINDLPFLIIISSNENIHVMSINETFISANNSMFVPANDHTKELDSLNKNIKDDPIDIYISADEIITFFLDSQCFYDFGKNYDKLKLPIGTYILLENDFKIMFQIANYIPLDYIANVKCFDGSQIKKNIRLHYVGGGMLKQYIGIDFTFSSHNYKIIKTDINEDKVYNIPAYIHKSKITLGLVCPLDNMNDMTCFEKVYYNSQTSDVLAMNNTTHFNLVSVETLFENKEVTIIPKKKLVNSVVNAMESLLIIDKHMASSIYEKKQNISFRCECKVNGYKVNVNYLLQPLKKQDMKVEKDIIKWKVRLGGEKEKKDVENVEDVNLNKKYRTMNNSYSNLFNINMYVIYFSIFLIYIFMA